MSADNGIYVLKTPVTEGANKFEYRVIHAQAIENLNWEEKKPGEGNPKEIVRYYFGTTVYNNAEKALEVAEEMANEILNDDFCPILEYGICVLPFPHSFQWYLDRVDIEEFMNAL